MRRSGERRRAVGPASLARALGCAALLWAGIARADTPRLAGNVLGFDEATQRLTILDAGRQHVLTVSPETVVRAGGADKAVTDLHRGDRVVITLAPDDVTRAARISIAGPAARSQSGRGSAAGMPSFSGPNARSLPR